MNRAYKKRTTPEEPFVDRRTLVFTLAVTLLVLGGTAFLIEFIIQPEIRPRIEKTNFNLTQSDFPHNTQKVYHQLGTSWVSGDLHLFERKTRELLSEREEELDGKVIFELHLYLLRSMYLRSAWNEGASLALSLQGRYSSHPSHVSDILFYRGHFIAKRDGVTQAASAFKQSAALGGRYADEANHISKRIERMNRPLW